IMNSKLSAQFIAAELNMSPRHLYRRLSEVESDSPADMIRESRLYIARNLLLNTKMTIDEIIYKSGFSNRATFFRQFAQKYGCTPKEYRDREMYDV
ncbi:helix-turn-helix domain-containing protein, partial [Dysgonomonas sp.]